MEIGIFADKQEDNTMSYLTILNWLYILAVLALAVMSAAMIKHRAGLFMALGLGCQVVAFVVNFVWYKSGLGAEFGHEIVRILAFLLRLTGVGLLTAAVVQFAQLTASLSTPTQAASVGMPSQSDIQHNTDIGIPPDNNFGSIFFYLILMVVGFVFLITGLVLLQSYRTEESGLMIIVLAGAAFIFAIIYLMIVLYRVWRFVIYQCRRYQIIPSIDTPGKAVGFLFIPFFSLYWVFIAFGKLPKDINAVLAARGQPPMLSEGLGMTIAVLLVISIIPLVGYLTGFIAEAILVPILIHQASKICQRLDDA